MEKTPIFMVENLKISFSQYTKGMRRMELEVISNLDIELYQGEILAVVGSSGSGKSLLAHAMLGILPANASTDGKMFYSGKAISQRDKEKLRGRKIALIPQSVNYLDPLEKVGKQIGASLMKKDKNEREKIVKAMLCKYGLDERVYHYYPHQLSGGMARKVLLCTALATDSDVIIADEPTPGLDEESLTEVLKDFRAVADSGKAVLLITHDINAACEIADKISIFYAGSTLEVANAEDMKGSGSKLRHPYTKALLRAMPSNEFSAIEGTQPLPGEVPKGCIFCDRCTVRSNRCLESRPEISLIRDGKVRCWNAS